MKNTIKLSPADFSLGIAHLTLVKEDELEMICLTKEGFEVELTFQPKAQFLQPQHFPKMMELLESQAQKYGDVMLSIGLVEMGNITAISELRKYKSGRCPTGSSFGAIYHLYTAGTKVHILLNTWEQGLIGIRENTVFLKNPKGFPGEKAMERRAISIEQYFEMKKKLKLVKLPSDEEQYDDIFPEHPLSRVRKMMRELEQNFLITRH